MVLGLTDIQLFQILKEKVGEKEAEALVEFVDTKVKESVKETSEQNLKVLATKEDLVNSIAKVRIEIADLRTELKTDIANNKAEIIKWMFIFWIGQLAASIAIAKFFFNK